MNEFPSTKEAAQTILEIIRTAQNRVVLISPFVDPTENFYKEIESASASGKSITLVCIESKLKQEVKNRLKSINNLQLLNHENVHAKCYYSEELLLQTSLNLSQYSENHNIEIGTLFKRQENPERFYQALAIPEMIVQDGISRINRYSNASQTKKYNGINSYNFDKLKLTLFKEVPGKSGFCMRCHTTLKYLNGNFALCPTCYNKWAKHFNLNFIETYCHWCGKNYPTSKRKPFCLPCYRKYQDIINSQNTTNTNWNSTAEPFVSEKEKVGTATQKIIPAKSNKTYFVAAIISIVTLIGTWVTINHLHSNSSIAKGRNAILREIIHNYYTDLNKEPIQVGKYFASNIESFIKVKHLTPDGIDSLVNKDSKEFMYGETRILDSTFSVSNDPFGNLAVGFWINFRCYRKSKAQYEKCKVHEEFVFDANDKIITVNELKIEDLKYSFNNPD